MPRDTKSLNGIRKILIRYKTIVDEELFYENKQSEDYKQLQKAHKGISQAIEGLETLLYYSRGNTP